MPAGKRRTAGEWRRAFLAVLRATANVREACKAAGIHRSIAYDHRDADAAFAAEWRSALDDATDDLEAEARRRALEGTEEPVFWRGEQVGSIRRYSDTLIAFLLKAHRPRLYGDASRVELTGPDGGPVETHDVVDWRPDKAWMRDYARVAQEVGADADDAAADPTDEVQPA